MMRHEAIELRLRWAGAVLLLLLVAAAAFLTVRYLGIREGRWTTLLPGHQSTALHGLITSAHKLGSKLLSWLG